MKMSDGIEWAVHCCTLLAALPEGKSLSVKKLAAFFEVPPAYLAKQLQALSAEKIVVAGLGPRGGYRLARLADEISLLDVVNAIEGRTPSFQCTEIRQNGPSALCKSAYTRPCGIARAMHGAEKAWRKELGQVTLQDLNEGAMREVAEAQLQKTATWLQENQQ